MTDISPPLSVIIININGLTTPIKGRNQENIFLNIDVINETLQIQRYIYIKIYKD